MSRRAILFDLDGTLIDSSGDLATAVNAVRAEHGLAPHPVALVQTMVGEGGRLLLRRALLELLSPLPESAADALVESLFASFIALYDAVCLETTRLYPGLEELLRSWAARLPLAIVTNKPERLSRKIVGGLGISASFLDVIGGDTLATRKPDPAGILALCERLGVAPGPERVLLVGDSHIDAEAAARAGVAWGRVLWGYGRPRGLESFAPVFAATSAAELSAGIERWLSPTAWDRV
jgi:phosphoglycolate phosphatase